VWFVTRDGDGNDRPPQWVCAPLQVQARTRDDAANGWGYLLEFTDPDGNPKQWAMPVAMLSGEGAEWAARLADMGLEIAHGPAARSRLGQYIKTRHPGERVTCTDRVGWHGGAYVLPTRCIVPTAQAEGRRYVFQSEAGMEDTFRMRGDLDAWRAGVAALCVGNSRFVFAVACAFAGALLLPAGVESGGFHFRSGSSQGKTSALRIAASVWGRPDYVKRWRTTDNALEATAVQHSDGLLILDEIAQLDASKAGECAYMLANEQEKGRNTRGGLNRRQRTWRLLFLSSGEVSLSTHMAEAGKRVMAGQEVRMVDIPLDAGQGMGGVEELHGHASPGAMVEHLTHAAASCYGVAGREWLQWCCDHQAEIAARLVDMVEAVRAQLMPGPASEQVRRVARRFALVAAAGELASEAGITGWAAGAASAGVRRCFDDWLAARGHLDNGEDAQALAQVKAWIEKNGDALLTWLHRSHDDHRPNTALRAGFKRLMGEDGKPLKVDEAMEYMERRSAAESSERFNATTDYLILPEAWKREVCKGLDAAAVAELMRKRGHLEHEAGRLMRSHRVPGLGRVKLYHLKSSLLADEL
jgi:putative DNA primase/helicase